VGSLRFSFRTVPHFRETFAICAQSADGGGRLVFGGDCGPADSLVEFARDSDLLIAEGTLPRPERTGVRGHLTPREAGEHARAAGAQRLVLTHISDELDALWAREEAAEAFGGPVRVAREGDVFDV
jgi:ribonuclease BN (tRNA processing enzyme)